MVALPFLMVETFHEPANNLALGHVAVTYESRHESASIGYAHFLTQVRQELFEVLKSG
jgi:hypothetical protein